MTESRYEKAANGGDDDLIDLMCAAHDICMITPLDVCDEGSPGHALHKALEKMGWNVEKMGKVPE